MDKILKKNKIYILLFLSVVFIDQIIKYLIRSRSGFYVCNPNFAFDIQLPIYAYWIALLLVVVLIFKIFNSKKLNILSISLIISGALSNAIDRLSLGCVVDFIDLKFWPIFNLADIAITLGILQLLAEYLKKWYNNPERKS